MPIDEWTRKDMKKQNDTITKAIEYIKNNDIEKFHELLKTGLSPNAVDDENVSLLSIALAEKNAQIVELLQDFDVLINSEIIEYAFWNCNYDIAKVLLKNIDKNIDLQTPLHNALYMANLEVVRAFVENDIDMNQIFDEESILMYISKTNLEVMPDIAFIVAGMTAEHTIKWTLMKYM